MRSRLHELMNNPWTNALMGILLVATGLVEVITPFLDEAKKGDTSVGAHHGVTLYGVYVFLRSVSEVLKGKREMAEGLEKVEVARGKTEPG